MIAVFTLLIVTAGLCGCGKNVENPSHFDDTKSASDYEAVHESDGTKEQDIDTDGAVEEKAEIDSMVSSLDVSLNENFMLFLQGEKSADLSEDIILFNHPMMEEYYLSGTIDDMKKQFIEVNNTFLEEWGGDASLQEEDIIIQYGVSEKNDNVLFVQFSVHNMRRYLTVYENENKLKIVLEGDDSEKYGFYVSDQGIINYSGSTSAYTSVLKSYVVDDNGTLKELMDIESYYIEKSSDGVYQLSDDIMLDIGVINVCRIANEKYYFCYNEEEIKQDKEKVISDISCDGEYISYERFEELYKQTIGEKELVYYQLDL